MELNPLELDEKVLHYENYINNVLREDLRILNERLLDIGSKAEDLIQHQKSLEAVTDKKYHPDGFTTQVRLGEKFYMEAVVHDPSTVLVDIGLNCFLEFSVPEALKYLDFMIKIYVAKEVELKNKIAETNAHIKVMLLGVDQLINVNKKT